MDWKGNSLTPDGTSRWHRLQVTTKVLRPEAIGNMKDSIGEEETNISTAHHPNQEQLYGCLDANQDTEPPTDLVMFLQCFFLTSDLD
jgi:hypothetical protein